MSAVIGSRRFPCWFSGSAPSTQWRVVVHKGEGNLVHRRLRGAGRLQDVDAVALVLDHPRAPAHLALDAPQAPQDSVLRACGEVAGDPLLPSSEAGTGRHGVQAHLGSRSGPAPTSPIEASDLTLVSGDLRGAARRSASRAGPCGPIEGNLFWAFPRAQRSRLNGGYSSRIRVA